MTPETAWTLAGVSGAAIALALFGVFAMRMAFGKLVRDLTPLLLLLGSAVLLWHLFRLVDES